MALVKENRRKTLQDKEVSKGWMDMSPKLQNSKKYNQPSEKTTQGMEENVYKLYSLTRD